MNTVASVILLILVAFTDGEPIVKIAHAPTLEDCQQVVDKVNADTNFPRDVVQADGSSVHLLTVEATCVSIPRTTHINTQAR